jgi:hypothetical protein
MAKEAGVNKSAAVREILAKNPNAKPSEISAQLKDKGIQISPTFASVVKSNYRRAQSGKKVRTTGRAYRRARAANNGATSLAEITTRYRRALDAKRKELRTELSQIERRLAAL